MANIFTGLWGKMFARGYDAGDSNRMRKDLGWDRRTSTDEDSLLKDGTLELMRQKATDLRRNNAVVAGVCDRLSLFTVGSTGIIPQAKTSDTGWNRAAEQFWAEWSSRCDSRRRVNLLCFQSQAVSLRPTHGGLYFQKLSDGTIRPIETERIRNPVDKTEAKSFVDGVRVDPMTGQIDAYCVHSRDDSGAFTMKHAEAKIPAQEVIPVIRNPWRPDQIREVPDFAPIIPTLQDIHEMNQYTLNSAKIQSMVIGFLKKQGGGALNSLPRGSTPTVGKRQTFQMDWGEIMEGFPGDDLDMKSSPTPSSNHIPYIKMQLALCSSALSMPYEFFTLDLSGLDYSRMKGLLLFINFATRPWKKWLIDSMLTPMWNWRIAMEMGKRGSLRKAPSKSGMSEWNMVDWQAPEEPWIDRQEAMQSDILEIQAGMSTFGQAAKRRGKDLETLWRDKAEEEILRQQLAQEYKLPPDTISKMQIPGQTEPAEQPEPEEKEEEPEEKDGEAKTE